MSARRVVMSALILAVGYAAAGGLFWLLLNVPESNVLALLASALLALATVACAGLTTAAAVATAQGAEGRGAMTRAVRTLPLFVLGVLVFGALWWATGSVDAWWLRHRGEIDAVILRYAGLTNTLSLHTTESWLTRMLRWGLGLSIVAGLAAAGGVGARRAAITGLRTGVRLMPLAAVILATVIVSEGLWRLAYWRPRSLPASSAELMFVVAKLGCLYVILIAIVAVVLDVHRRVTERRAAT